MTQSALSLKTQFVRFSRTGAWHSLGLQVLIATAALMVAALILMSVTLSNLKQSTKESEATQDTLLQITTVESRLIEFDGALSGFALSGAPLFQARMRADRADIGASLDQLKRSLQNDPLQLQRYNGLTSLIHKWYAAGTYLGRPEHRSEIESSPVSKSASLVRDSIRERLWDILERERAKRQLNNTAMVSQTQTSLLFSLGIVLLSFVFGTLCLVLAISAKA